GAAAQPFAHGRALERLLCGERARKRGRPIRRRQRQGLVDLDRATVRVDADLKSPIPRDGKRGGAAEAAQTTGSIERRVHLRRPGRPREPGAPESVPGIHAQDLYVDFGGTWFRWQDRQSDHEWPGGVGDREALL